MDLELQGKVVLVTGGSKGIGLACARSFAAEGARVAIASRNAENLAQAEGKLRDVLPGGAANAALMLGSARVAGRRGDADGRLVKHCRLRGQGAMKSNDAATAAAQAAASSNALHDGEHTA